MKKFSIYKYSLLFSLIYFFQLFLTSSGHNSLFIIVSIIGLVILFFFIMSIRRKFYLLKDQLVFKRLDFFSKIFDISHHLIVPMILHLATCMMLFFTRLLFTQVIIIFISFILFTILFKNIYAYFSDDVTNEISTNKIYDLIVMYSYFIINYVFGDLVIYYGLNFNLTLISFLLATLFFSLISILRYHKEEIILITVILCVQVIAFLIFSPVLNVFKLVVFETIIFSFLMDYLYHGQLKQKIEVKLIIEYILFAVIMTIVLYYI